MKSKRIQEGKALLNIPIEKKISKKLPIFYNPIMKLNRDISIILINTHQKKELQIALPLAGTGIRGIRFLLELKKNKIKHLYLNDYSEKAIELIKENLKLNKLKTKTQKITTLSTKDANLFLLNSKGFDYIDIDPFGTPNQFLDSAIIRLSRNGILAVTATDTSALCGTYPNSCLRKYWATHNTNTIMHELGLRILIRKVQLIASQHEKALTPIFSYSKDHYMRVFFECEKSKQKTDKILKQHEIINNYGPLWTGQLWDQKLTAKILKNTQKTDKELHQFISIIAEESKINTVGFFNIHQIVKQHKLKTIPKKEALFKEISKKYKISLTHFNPISIKSTISLRELIKTIKKLNKTKKTKKTKKTNET